MERRAHPPSGRQAKREQGRGKDSEAGPETAKEPMYAGWGKIEPAKDKRSAEIGTDKGTGNARQRARLIPRRAQATADRMKFGR